MKLSKMLLKTLRETPAEAEIASHQLMLRAGIMRKLAAGVYSFLPLGLRSLHKVEQIIREEMDAAGAQELLMSALLPAEYYQESGRWDVFGPEMFRLRDRNSRDFCLGPTHEEIFTQTVKGEVSSYRQLPLTLYQIQTKYRDERRPRFGVMRSREFIMKDAYSFDLDEAGLDVSYQNMYKAYCRVFDRLGLDYIVVDADSGAMGGSGSQEFMVKSDTGEAVVAFCSHCGYAANDEKAECVPEAMPQEEPKAMEKIYTPNAGTIEELVEFLGTDSKHFAKTLIYMAGEKPVAVMVRGDREVNETKLANLLGINEQDLAMAEANVVTEVTGARVGFAGPVGLTIPVYCDKEVALMCNYIVGANESDYHFTNVNAKDFTPEAIADLRTIEAGDVCPRCGQPVETTRGVEVGHIFKLGKKYTEALDCTYLDENGKAQTSIMGCYGIGVNRTLAAVIEQYSDENGIIWPVSAAPYQVIVVPVNMANEEQAALAEKIYSELRAKGIEVLMDDRDERPGVKFKDADLIGIPVRITVGKKASEGLVEYKLRKSQEVLEISAEQAVQDACTWIADELAFEREN
ncbi:MAG: proline--tRNA ligase [Ruminococcaceae bacterium]|nr:proline--tRNA ligase [Oscillospiraceae bacterium]